MFWIRTKGSYPKKIIIVAGPQPTETDITFYITIRRKTLFYTVNLILPTVNKYNIYNIIYILINTFHHIMQVLISFLCVLVFYLPAEVSIIIISFVRSSSVYSSLIYYIPGGQAPNVSEFTANIIPVTRVKQDQLHSSNFYRINARHIPCVYYIMHYYSIWQSCPTDAIFISLSLWVTQIKDFLWNYFLLRIKTGGWGSDWFHTSIYFFQTPFKHPATPFKHP